METTENWPGEEDIKWALDRVRKAAQYAATEVSSMNLVLRRYGSRPLPLEAQLWVEAIERNLALTLQIAKTAEHILAEAPDIVALVRKLQKEHKNLGKAVKRFPKEGA